MSPPTTVVEEAKVRGVGGGRRKQAAREKTDGPVPCFPGLHPPPQLLSVCHLPNPGTCPPPYTDLDAGRVPESLLILQGAAVKGAQLSHGWQS